MDHQENFLGNLAECGKNGNSKYDAHDPRAISRDAEPKNASEQQKDQPDEDDEPLRHAPLRIV